MPVGISSVYENHFHELISLTSCSKDPKPKKPVWGVVSPAAGGTPHSPMPQCPWFLAGVLGSRFSVLGFKSQAGFVVPFCYTCRHAGMIHARCCRSCVAAVWVSVGWCAIPEVVRARADPAAAALHPRTDCCWSCCAMPPRVPQRVAAHAFESAVLRSLSVGSMAATAASQLMEAIKAMEMRKNGQLEKMNAMR